MRKFTQLKAMLVMLMMMVGMSAWAETYKLQQVSSVTAGGKYVFVQENRAMIGTVSNSAVQTTASYNNKGLTGNESYVWVLEKYNTTGGYKIKNVSSSKYLNNTSSGETDMALGGSNNAKWVFDFTDPNAVVIQNSDNGNRFLGFTSSTSYAYKAYAASYLKKNTYPHAIKVYQLVEEKKATLSINAACTDGKTCYSTYSNESAFVVPEDLTVSVIGADSEGSLMVKNYATGDVVAANTGVMVSGNAGEHTIELTTDEATVAPGENNLHPSSEAMTGDNKFYRLTMHNGENIGFWWGAADGAAFSLGTNKAYLAVPNSVAVKSGIWFSDEDVIRNIEVTDNSTPIYGLNGMRANTARKGIYIINGRKIVK